MKHPTLILILFIVLLTPITSQAEKVDSLHEDLKNLVVLIQGSIGGNTFQGSGFIFDKGDGRIGILTANHVVRRSGQNAERIDVTFRFAPSKTYPAVLHPDHDAKFDIALLTVEDSGLFLNSEQLHFDRLGNTSSLERGDLAYVVGHPNGILWQINVLPGRVSEVQEDELIYESSLVAPGQSGGLLISDDGEILGMLKGENPPGVRVMRIESILDRVFEWKHEISLRPPVYSGGIVSVSAGGQHACAIDEEQVPYCWGGNHSGQIGDDTTIPRRRPVRVRGIRTLTSISAGVNHTCGLDKAGAVYCWGGNQSGQLGDGTNTTAIEPRRVETEVTFRSVNAGKEYTCGISTGYDLYCWGDNDKGQLGMGSINTFLRPSRVITDQKFKGVSVNLSPQAGSHTCAISNDGFLYCWGFNQFGQVGDQTGSDEREPTAVFQERKFKDIAVASNRTCGVDSNGNLLCWGEGSTGLTGLDEIFSNEAQRQMHKMSDLKFKAVAGGQWHMCGISASNQLHCWGWNSDGQLGIAEENASRPALSAKGLNFNQVDLGSRFSCAISPKNDLWCFGSNNSGQLGLGPRRAPALVTR